MGKFKKGDKVLVASDKYYTGYDKINVIVTIVQVCSNGYPHGQGYDVKPKKDFFIRYEDDLRNANWQERYKDESTTNDKLSKD